MESQSKGDLTEAIVITELKRREVPVSVPFGDNERYDLVLEAPQGRMYRAQVKTGRTCDGTVQFKGYSQHTNAEGHTYKPYTDGIDCFLVYSHDYERLFLVLVDEIRAVMTIRIEQPDQRHESTNWGEDYEFDARWPPVGPRLRSTVQGRSPAIEPVMSVLRAHDVPFLNVVDEQYHLVACATSGRRYELRACSGNVVRGRIRFNTVDGDFDAYCVHCSETDEVYLVPDDCFGESISLRVEPPDQPDVSINRAEDYRFEEQWPP